MWKWIVGLCFLAWVSSVLYDDVSTRMKQAQSRAWYEANVQREHSGREGRAREWREFKECIANGDKPEDCANQ